MIDGYDICNSCIHIYLSGCCCLLKVIAALWKITYGKGSVCICGQACSYRCTVFFRICDQFFLSQGSFIRTFHQIEGKGNAGKSFFFLFSLCDGLSQFQASIDLHIPYIQLVFTVKVFGSGFRLCLNCICTGNILDLVFLTQSEGDGFCNVITVWTSLFCQFVGVSLNQKSLQCPGSSVLIIGISFSGCVCGKLDFRLCRICGIFQNQCQLIHGFLWKWISISVNLLDGKLVLFIYKASRLCHCAIIAYFCKLFIC